MQNTAKSHNKSRLHRVFGMCQVLEKNFQQRVTKFSLLVAIHWMATENYWRESTRLFRSNFAVISQNFAIQQPLFLTYGKRRKIQLNLPAVFIDVTALVLNSLNSHFMLYFKLNEIEQWKSSKKVTHPRRSNDVYHYCKERKKLSHRRGVNLPWKLFGGFRNALDSISAWVHGANVLSRTKESLVPPA